ncbi:MAG TPA: hypothetical protein VFD43_12755, partial [Planctomycetota bacterium]|nr:hypothetical protein [Planctomycetota bacterium]
MRRLPSLALSALLAIPALGATAGRGAAQSELEGPDPVHVTLRGPAAAVPAGGRFEVVLEADIDAPYHIYAHDSPGGILPTRVEATVADGAAGAGLALERIVQPDAAAQTKYDAILEETHKTLEGTVEFKAVFAVAADAAAGERQVSVTAEYMACNAEGCLFPVTKGGP